MRLSDLIAEFIQSEIEREGGAAELQRAALADKFDCVPSQINYVLTSRFTPELGYIVETRRGGGGYIRIERKKSGEMLLHAINSIGGEVDAQSCRVFLKNFLQAGIIGKKEAELIWKAILVVENVAPPPQKAAARAEMLKQMLITLCS